MKTPQNKHLDYFYILLPSVTINFVEYILMAKERLSKNNPHEAFFFDDGFILGMSYFLKLTEQFETFNSCIGKMKLRITLINILKKSNRWSEKVLRTKEE